ncbi:MAG TPA: hypothetical protein VF060_23555 [Trebonia sp.]
MKIVIYGDFGCPYSYLASIRADTLLRSGAAEIDWRAVAPDRGRPRGGRDDPGQDLAISLFAQPGEPLPRPAPGPVDVRSAVSAYAEAVSDGVPHQMRRRLFAAIWAEARQVSDVYQVRKLIAEVMCPPEPITHHLISPDLPSALLHDPDVNRIVRRCGGTVTVYGGPLTAAGDRRVRQWRREWLSLPCAATPVVINPFGDALPFSVALDYLLMAVEDGRSGAPARTAGSGTVPRQGRRAGTEARIT